MGRQRKSPKPLVWRTLDINIYNKLIQLYPGLGDESKSERWLAWLLIDSVAYSGATEIQLFAPFIRSLCYITKDISSIKIIEEAFKIIPNLFVLKDFGCAYDEFYEEGFLEDYPSTDYIPNQFSRVAQFIGGEVVKDLFDEYYQSKYQDDQKMVYIATGKKVTPKSTRTMKEKQIDYSTELFQSYKDIEHLPHMIEYAYLVTELANNKSRRTLINRNLDFAYQRIEECYSEQSTNAMPIQIVNQLTGDITYVNSSDQALERYIAYKRSLDNLEANEYNIYRLVQPFTPRIFDEVDQTIKNDLRPIIYKDCSDIDLCRSQAAIISSLADSDNLKTWVDNDNLWNDLLKEIGLLPSDKRYIKTCLYTLCFGGYKDAIVDEFKKKGWLGSFPLTEIIKTLKHPFFKEVRKCCKRLMNVIEKDGYVEIEEMKFELIDKKFEARHALAKRVQYIESMIIYSIVQTIASHTKITLIGAYHDGVLVSIKDKAKIPSILNTLNRVAQETGKSFGVSNIKLEIK